MEMNDKVWVVSWLALKGSNPSRIYTLEKNGLVATYGSNQWYTERDFFHRFEEDFNCNEELRREVPEEFLK